MTLREVQRCTKDDIRINTFMLEDNYYLREFVERMMKMNRGRAFFTTPETLGDYVLVDFLDQTARAAPRRLTAPGSASTLGAQPPMRLLVRARRPADDVVTEEVRRVGPARARGAAPRGAGRRPPAASARAGFEPIVVADGDAAVRIAVTDPPDGVLRRPHPARPRRLVRARDPRSPDRAAGRRLRAGRRREPGRCCSAPSPVSTIAGRSSPPCSACSSASTT